MQRTQTRRRRRRRRGKALTCLMVLATGWLMSTMPTAERLVSARNVDSTTAKGVSAAERKEEGGIVNGCVRKVRRGSGSGSQEGGALTTLHHQEVTPIHTLLSHASQHEAGDSVFVANDGNELPSVVHDAYTSLCLRTFLMGSGQRYIYNQSKRSTETLKEYNRGALWCFCCTSVCSS